MLSPDESPTRALALAEQEILRRLKMPTRARQKEVLAALAAGRNVFAGLPTGYGKSACAWAPAAAWGWRVWVVCPLVSLIQDQAMAAAGLGLRTAAWYGRVRGPEREQLEKETREAQICFLSPERLAAWWEGGFADELAREGAAPDLLVLDEMHCFEGWRRFRSGYRDAFLPIRRLGERGTQLLGLSASLSRAQATLWMNELCSNHVYVGSGLGRDNLTLRILPVDSEAERWLGLVAELGGLDSRETALVYCHTRAECDDLSRWLRSAGFAACAFHAGLPAGLRAARMEGFRRGALRVVCATTAFGMGVDYPRVRRVIHFSLPSSLEAYWQEVGRAGRDGAPAEGLVLWRRSEIKRARMMNIDDKENFFALWHAWASGKCRKQTVAECFGVVEERCGKCDRCRPEERSVRPAWWVEPEARLAEWAKEKIFSGKS